MRYLLFTTLLLASSCCLFGQSQDAIGFNALSARALVIRHTVADTKKSFGTNTYGMELGIRRQFSDNFAATVPIKLAVIDLGESRNFNVAAFDVVGNYYPIGVERVFSPYLIAGIGFVFKDKDDSYGQFPMGGGVNLRLGDNFSLQLQAEYRYSGINSKNMTVAGIGYTYQFGGFDNTDSDRDGIPDRLDDCPEDFGPKSAKGCPDADLDGVIDGVDRCPNLPGLERTFGCPDRDDDGIADQKDLCPDQPGTRETLGCPDYDKDGVPDIEDKCPAQPGKKLFQGCPDTDNDGVPDDIDPCPNDAGSLITGCPDRDGDGYHDLEDKCPDQAGPNAGCPEIEADVKARLEQATSRVNFDGRSDQLTPASYPSLDDVADVMTAYPTYQLIIEGHTANDGTEDNNQALSELRALTCRGYLISKGIAAERIKVLGRGASRPRADNNTATGRELNRRMVFLLVPDEK